MRDLLYFIKQKDQRMQMFIAEEASIKEAKRREIEETKEAKRAFEAERLKRYREELAEQNRRAEEEGEVEEVFVDEFACEPCKKTFKKEGQLQNHI